MMCCRLALAVLLCLLPLSGRGALHLMLPYDYLSLGEEERCFYLLGVLDVRMDWRSTCIERHRLNGIRDVLGQQGIPSPETASIPLPYPVERVLVTACGAPMPASPELAVLSPAEDTARAIALRRFSTTCQHDLLDAQRERVARSWRCCTHGARA